MEIKARFVLDYSYNGTTFFRSTETEFGTYGDVRTPDNTFDSLNTAKAFAEQKGYPHYKIYLQTDVLVWEHVRYE